MMRIGMLAPEFLPQVGGMPAYASGMAAALARFHDVTLYTMRGRGTPGMPYAQRPLLTRDLGAAKRALAHERVDVWYALNAGCLALAPALDAPLVGTVHGNDFLNPWLFVHRAWVARVKQMRYLWRHEDRLRQHLIRRDLRRGVAAAAHVCAVSEFSRRAFVERYPGAAGKISVVPPGVDDRFFAQPCRDRRPVRTPLKLLTVTRLESWTRRKNVDGVLRALATAGAASCEYVVVGDGDDRARLEHLARELGVDRRVCFTGRVDERELAARYADADLFVLAADATPHDVEGFGIVYLEAAAMGLPSLCSAAGGATDAVRDGVTGVVIDASDPASIAQGLVRFLRERERFAPEILREHASRFRWPSVATAIRARLMEAAA